MGPLSIAMAAMGTMGGATDGRPITLVTEATTGGVIVQVVGGASEPTQATYTLEVSSGTTGGNQSVQSGTARLAAGQHVVLLTARLGGSAGAKWKAQLNVHPAGQPGYEIVRQSD